MNRKTLEHLAREWRRNVVGRNLFLAFGVGWLATACIILTSGYRRTWWGLVLFAAVVRAPSGGQPPVADRRGAGRPAPRPELPEMEESGGLFLKSSGALTLLERLQCNRVSASVAARASGRRTPGGFGMPRRFLGAMYFCFAAVCLALLASAWLYIHPQRSEDTRPSEKPIIGQQVQPSPPSVPTWPRVTGGGLTITPPAYTARPPRRVEGFNADVEEGATVAWTLALDRPRARGAAGLRRGSDGVARVGGQAGGRGGGIVRHAPDHRCRIVSPRGDLT